ncbi:MAG: condensation domain-containing protein [Jatrophihabitantaceae bacterium]
MSESGPAPLTFGQMSLWRDIDALPRSRWQETNWVFEVDVPTGVSEDTIRQALERMTERHAGLRTVYDVSDPANPAQLVRSRTELPLEFETVTLASAEAVTAAAAELKARPFDLRTERPFRALLAGAPGCRTLLISKHHIAVDAWSMGLLADELTAMFTGDEQALPPPSEDLCALAREQRSATWQRRREASERHFRRMLDTPAARFRGLDDAHGAVQGYFESARLYADAGRVAREAHVSLSTVLISAYALAISELCTDLPIRFGLMASNRFGERWAGLITSMNQLVSIPLEPDADCLQQSALEAVQAQSLRAYRLALHDVDAMRPERLGLPADTDRTPTCMYNMVTPWVSEQSSPIQDGEVPEISWEPAFSTLGPRCYLRACETTTGTLLLVLRTNGLGIQATGQMLRRVSSAITEAAVPAVLGGR